MSEWIFLATESVENPEELVIHWGRGPFFTSPTLLPGRAAFYRNDFELTQANPWIYPREIQSLKLSDLAATLPPGEKQYTDWIPVLAESFYGPFSSIKNEIAAGRLHKAVPHLSQRGQLPRATPVEASASALLQSLTQKPSLLRHRFPFGWCFENEAYVGLSPELLFQQSGERISTMALAGTCTPEHEAGLMADPKERFEHELVIEGIQKSLFPFSTRLEKGETHTLNLGKLCHLRTHLTAEAKKDVEVDSLLRAMHPTPALGNYPRSSFRVPRTCPWLGAPIGFTDGHGTTTFVVTLRGVRIGETHLELSTGCGVTENSIFEREFRELELKRRAVRESFGL